MKVNKNGERAVSEGVKRRRIPVTVHDHVSHNFDPQIFYSQKSPVKFLVGPVSRYKRDIRVCWFGSACSWANNCKNINISRRLSSVG